MVGTKEDSAVIERRLRPVYDALDNLNNKQAIKLADNLLKKQKDLSCAKALKSLALIRSGRASEGSALLDDIVSSEPRYDDNTLQAMTMCYKETNRPAGIVSIYEVAVQQAPKNEEFLTHFFTSCVRVEDYPRQQKSAMNLYKAYPKNPYYFWAVMSNLMQALHTDDQKKKDMFLNLAERMVSKFIKEDKISAEEEIRLYMLILEQLGRFEELLTLLRGDFGDKLKCVLNERPEKEIEYLTALNNWAEVNLKYKKILENHPDQWVYYGGYFESVNRLKELKYVPDSPADTEVEIPDVTDEAVMTFLQKLRSDNVIMRGPFLAILEMYKRVHYESSGISGVEGEDAAPLELVDLLHQYYKEFGKKLCCFSDMRPYTTMLSRDQRMQFTEHLKTTYKSYTVHDQDVSHKDKVDDLMREICVECLCRQLECYKDLTHEEKFAKAMTYMKRYQDTLYLAENLNITEPQYGDTLVLLAAYLLLDINIEKGDNSMVWHVLLILEEAVESSPTFAQFKLLLLFLYGGLGAFGACEKLIFFEIEVRYIMFDSLGYLLTYGGYTSAHFQSTLRIHESAIGFFNSCAKDTPEQIIASYKYGSFRQIPEMTEFKKRVRSSHHFSYAVLENLYLDVMRFASSVSETKEKFDKIKTVLSCPQFENITIDHLSDNRDFRVMDNFEPAGFCLTEEQKAHSFAQNVCWIRLRYCILSAVNECLEASESSLNNSEEENTNTDKLGRNVSLLNEAIAASQQYSCDDTEWKRIHHPPPSYMVTYTKEEFGQVISTLVTLCSRVVKDPEVDEEKAQAAAEDLKSVEQQLKKTLTTILGSLTRSHGVDAGLENTHVTRMFNGNCLPAVVFYVETCNFVAILLHCIQEVVKKNLASIRRNKKKRANDAPSAMKHDLVATSIKELYVSLHADLTLLQQSLTAVKESDIDTNLDSAALEELFEKTNCTTVAQIWHKVQESFQQSIMEFGQVLTLKINFFRTLMT